MLGGREDKSSAAALAHKEHGVPLQLSDRDRPAGLLFLLFHFHHRQADGEATTNYREKELGRDEELTPAGWPPIECAVTDGKAQL